MKFVPRLFHSLAVLSLAVFAGLSVSCGLLGPKRPNIVIIVIDTLRADHLPFYGYELNTAPFLDSLSASSTVFDNAYSTSSWTAPATASLFTSLYPFQHTVVTGYRGYLELVGADESIQLNRIPADIETLPEVVKMAGYSTFAVTDNLNICDKEGFDQGFDMFANFNDETARKVNRQVLQWEEALNGSRPYFLYLHYMDPHWEYTAHNTRQMLHGPAKRRDEPTSQATIDRAREYAYDTEIDYVDKHIMDLFERFGWDHNTLVIVTSDHGEEFKDHGGYKHGLSLYDEVMRVPLLVYYPEGGIAAQRVAANVSLIDILPTVRAFAGLPALEQDQGVDLLPMCRQQTDKIKNRVLYGHLWRKYGTLQPEDDLMIRASVWDGWKYLWTMPDREEVYDLKADPRERANVIGAAGARAAAARADYVDFESNCLRYEPEHTDMILDEKLYKKLKSLGYVH